MVGLRKSERDRGEWFQQPMPEYAEKYAHVFDELLHGIPIPTRKASFLRGNGVLQRIATGLRGQIV
ncbi:hypothetical protein SAMN05216345_10719 [Cupriavidus sp. YR651]|nr:hypothetical protein SAMN05216345_10719 [Cupriavidus sp. YR651]